MYRDTSSVDCAPRELTHACSEVWRRIKSAKETALRALTHHMPQEETESLCNSFAQ